MSILGAIRQWPVDHVAAAAILPGGRIEVDGDSDTTFELASLTKLLVACGVLVAVEDETLDLDQPAGHEGSTLRHLLAHASGLEPDGEQVLAQPGTRRIYSNTGYVQAGRLLEHETGLPLAVYIDESVLQPLSMRDTAMGGSAATGARGTIHDLVRFAADVMAPEPTILAASSRDLATSVAFPGLAGVLPGFGSQDTNDWGLGFEIRDSKWPHWSPDSASPQTFGHFGRAGSLLWIDPTLPAALAVLGDRPFGDWAPSRWRDLGDAVIDAATGQSGPSRQHLPSPADGDSAVVKSGVSR
jgi:CubicO group peptidase (beta-lactamase class C family)